MWVEWSSGVVELVWCQTGKHDRKWKAREKVCKEKGKYVPGKIMRKRRKENKEKKKGEVDLVRRQTGNKTKQSKQKQEGKIKTKN